MVWILLESKNRWPYPALAEQFPPPPDDTASEAKCISVGVTQDTVLNPLQFTVMMSDFTVSTQNSPGVDLRMFAYDIALRVTHINR